MNEHALGVKPKRQSAGGGAAGAPFLRTRNLHKYYKIGGQDLHVLRGVDMTVGRGEALAILGRSGSGKSTLLHLLGGLDRPNEGTVYFDGTDIFRLRGRKLDRYRSTHIGFVFQFYHLLPELSTLENVMIGGMISRSILRWPGARLDVRQHAIHLLEQVGLADRMKHRPGKLSGGERQRVAIARALINQPAVLLADEPTGNLDAETSAAIMKLFASLHDAGQTMVLVTHDQNIADTADRVLHLVNGRLQ